MRVIVLFIALFFCTSNVCANNKKQYKVRKFVLENTTIYITRSYKKYLGFNRFGKIVFKSNSNKQGLCVIERKQDSKYTFAYLSKILGVFKSFTPNCYYILTDKSVLLFQEGNYRGNAIPIRSHKNKIIKPSKYSNLFFVFENNKLFCHYFFSDKGNFLHHSTSVNTSYRQKRKKNKIKTNSNFGNQNSVNSVQFNNVENEFSVATDLISYNETDYYLRIRGANYKKQSELYYLFEQGFYIFGKNCHYQKINLASNQASRIQPKSIFILIVIDLYTRYLSIKVIISSLFIFLASILAYWFYKKIRKKQKTPDLN